MENTYMLSSYQAVALARIVYKQIATRHDLDKYRCSSDVCRSRTTGVLRCLNCRAPICYLCDRVYDGLCQRCLSYFDRVNHYQIQKRDLLGRFTK